jgi:HEAT repeat protein
MDSFERCRTQLERYLAPGVSDEIQMGAVSGLADTRSPEAAGLLIAALGRLSPHNRGLALDALLRAPERARALLDAVAEGRLKATEIGEERLKKLQEHPDEEVRRRAKEVLK